MTQNGKIFFKTFGCRTNIYDTALMQRQLGDMEVVGSLEEAECVVINSCSVTNRAQSSVKQFIKRAKSAGKSVYLTGCSVHAMEPEELDALGISGYFGHAFKERMAEVLGAEEFREVGTLDFEQQLYVDDFEGRSRAFLKIQEGCDFACAYCVIPSTRGASRSRKREDIIKQVLELCAKGYSEFVLTGTNVGSFREGSYTLGHLIEELCELEGVKRLRLGSVEPTQVDERFLEAIRHERFSRHLHIALQHSEDGMLEKMHRINRVEESLELFERLQAMGFALGTDYIIGHPGESEERFLRGLANLERFPLTHIHPFSFSPKKGTPSADMKEKVPKKIAKERLGKIKTLIEAKNRAFRERQGALQVLVESGADGRYSGYDQFYNRVEIESDKNIKGAWIEVSEYRAQEQINFAEV